MKIWKWFDGKKTTLSGVYWMMYFQVLPVWFGDDVPERLGKVLITIGMFLTYFGLGHKVVKGDNNKQGAVK